MFFAQAVDDIIESRRALIESGAEAPRDLLTLLLSARDPENGRGISDEDVRANILTFILAGHETTANALTWTLFLMSNRPSGASGRRPRPRRRSICNGRPRPRAARRCAPFSRRRCAFIRLPRCSVVRRSPTTNSRACIFPPARYIGLALRLHRRRGLWDNPDAFDPSRFLGDRRDRIHRFAYIPFGGARGVHRHGLRDAGRGHSAGASSARLSLRSVEGMSSCLSSV